LELHLLLVDSDDARRDDLSGRLRDDGFTVHAAVGLESAMALAEHCLPHVALVDLRFADGTAEVLARQLGRAGNVPFVVVSANNNGEARIRALEQFADDFVTLPYVYAELLARVRRVLRRALICAPIGDERIDLGQGRSLDLRHRTIVRDGRTDHLTPTEARLLELFVRNPDRVLTSDLIIQRVWSDAPVGVNTLWEFIRRLRIKLGDTAPRRHDIRSARGIGYQFSRRDLSASGNGAPARRGSPRSTTEEEAG
jgi:two-component system KDP operon response regulator KdpE